MNGTSSVIENSELSGAQSSRAVDDPVTKRRTMLMSMSEVTWIFPMYLSLVCKSFINLSRRSKLNIKCLPWLEEEDRFLVMIEIDEMFGLVRHVASELAADDAVPGRLKLGVELFLDVGGDVLLDAEFLEGVPG